jgi:hypothetical protein
LTVHEALCPPNPKESDTATFASSHTLALSGTKSPAGIISSRSTEFTAGGAIPVSIALIEAIASIPPGRLRVSLILDGLISFFPIHWESFFS